MAQPGVRLLIPGPKQVFSATTVLQDDSMRSKSIFNYDFFDVDFHPDFDPNRRGLPPLRTHRRDQDEPRANPNQIERVATSSIEPAYL